MKSSLPESLYLLSVALLNFTIVALMVGIVSLTAYVICSDLGCGAVMLNERLQGLLVG